MAEPVQRSRAVRPRKELHVAGSMFAVREYTAPADAYIRLIEDFTEILVVAVLQCIIVHKAEFFCCDANAEFEIKSVLSILLHRAKTSMCDLVPSV